jgi:hypothetical protein
MPEILKDCANAEINDAIPCQKNNIQSEQCNQANATEFREKMNDATQSNLNLNKEEYIAIKIAYQRTLLRRKVHTSAPVPVADTAALHWPVAP